MIAEREREINDEMSATDSIVSSASCSRFYVALTGSRVSKNAKLKPTLHQIPPGPWRHPFRYFPTHFLSSLTLFSFPEPHYHRGKL